MRLSHIIPIYSHAVAPFSVFDYRLEHSSTLKFACLIGLLNGVRINGDPSTGRKCAYCTCQRCNF